LTKNVNEEEFSVPRLSIIIPHRSDDQRLEETILSVLENRPRDCEIIVVHDGSYLDPYQLADEVVYVQEEPHSSVTELLNAGLMAACSPVVCTLLDGVLVSANWSEAAMKRFVHAGVAAVAPQVRVGKKVVSGIARGALRSVSQLRKRVDASESEQAISPVLTAGFYRRKILLALGGWNDEAGASTADIELALLLNALDLTCESEPNSVVAASARTVPLRNSKEASYELAGIAAAHGLASAKLTSAFGAIALGCLTGNVAASWSWASGLLSNNLSEQVVDRLARARRQLDSLHGGASIKMYSESAATGQTAPSHQRKAA